MHSIIKNLSKVLALTILSTNFSPSFVSAGKSRCNSKAPEAKFVTKTSTPEQLFNQQIERFTKLGEGQFIVADDFKTQDSYENAYLMLKQLNDLFDKYPHVLKAFIKYCKASHIQFTVTTPVSATSSTHVHLKSMFFYVPNTVDGLENRSINGFTARVDKDKYLQAVVSHEFGHLMSFLKCITDYAAHMSGTCVSMPPAKGLVVIYNVHSQTIRNAIARKYGHAPYISHYANQKPPTVKLLSGAELSASASATVNVEYFAELFSYTECNSKAPKRLKTALHEIIDTWFVDLPARMRPIDFPFDYFAALLANLNPEK